jgi:hypothetical protein
VPRGNNDSVDDLAKELLFLLEAQLRQAGDDMLTEKRKVLGDGFPFLPLGSFGLEPMSALVPVRDLLLETMSALGKFRGAQSTLLVPVDKPADLALGIHGLVLESLKLGLDDIGRHEASVFSLTLPSFGHDR